MSSSQDHLLRPWGLSRATKPKTVADPPWTAVTLDHATQLTIFYDQEMRPLDLAKGTSQPYVTVIYSKPGDGAKNAPEVPDNSATDYRND